MVNKPKKDHATSKKGKSDNAKVEQKDDDATISVESPAGKIVQMDIQAKSPEEVIKKLRKKISKEVGISEEELARQQPDMFKTLHDQLKSKPKEAKLDIELIHEIGDHILALKKCINNSSDPRKMLITTILGIIQGLSNHIKMIVIGQALEMAGIREMKKRNLKKDE